MVNLATQLKIPYLANCIQLELEGDKLNLQREIDGGKEILTATFPLVIGAQKGLVEESDLKIPNMRGIMMARKKPLRVIEPENIQEKTRTISFEKPAPKGAIKMVDAENIDELITLLHNEAKVL